MELREEIPHPNAAADKKQMCLGPETNDKYKEFKRHW